MGLLVAAHEDRDVRLAIFRVPALLVEPRDGYVAQRAVFVEGTEGGAAIDALVFVDFGPPEALAVVDADMHLGALARVLDAHAEVDRSWNQPEAFGEERPDHAIAVDGLLEREPG